MAEHGARAKDPINWDMFGRTVTGACKARGMSLRELARELGVSAPTTSRVARGIGCDVHGYALLCRWLGVSLDTFVRSLDEGEGS